MSTQERSGLPHPSSFLTITICWVNLSGPHLIVAVLDEAVTQEAEVRPGAVLLAEQPGFLAAARAVTMIEVDELFGTGSIFNL